MPALTAIEQTLIDLLKVDSPTGGEHELADTIERWAKEAGWRVRRHELCLIVDRPKKSGPRIGFFGHLDVVTTIGSFGMPPADLVATAHEHGVKLVSRRRLRIRFSAASAAKLARRILSHLAFVTLRGL